MAKLALVVGALAVLSGTVQSLGDDGTASLLCKTVPDGEVQEPLEETVTVPQNCLSVITSGTITPTSTMRQALPIYGVIVTGIAEEILDIELQHLAEQHKADIVRAITPPQLAFDKGAEVRHTNAKAAHDRWQAGATQIVESIMIEAGVMAS